MFFKTNVSTAYAKLKYFNDVYLFLHDMHQISRKSLVHDHVDMLFSQSKGAVFRLESAVLTVHTKPLKHQALFGNTVSRPESIGPIFSLH